MSRKDELIAEIRKYKAILDAYNLDMENKKLVAKNDSVKKELTLKEYFDIGYKWQALMNEWTYEYATKEELLNIIKELSSDGKGCDLLNI